MPSRQQMLFHSLLDLQRQLIRRGMPYKEPLNNPQKTVTAMRLLSAITDNQIRALVSHNLYKVVKCSINSVMLNCTVHIGPGILVPAARCH